MASSAEDDRYAGIVRGGERMTQEQVAKAIDDNELMQDLARMQHVNATASGNTEIASLPREQPSELDATAPGKKMRRRRAFVIETEPAQKLNYMPLTPLMRVHWLNGVALHRGFPFLGILLGAAWTLVSYDPDYVADNMPVGVMWLFHIPFILYGVALASVASKELILRIIRYFDWWFLLLNVTVFFLTSMIQWARTDRLEELGYSRSATLFRVIFIYPSAFYLLLIIISLDTFPRLPGLMNFKRIAVFLTACASIVLFISQYLDEDPDPVDFCILYCGGTHRYRLMSNANLMFFELKYLVVSFMQPDSFFVIRSRVHFTFGLFSPQAQVELVSEQAETELARKERERAASKGAAMGSQRYTVSAPWDDEEVNLSLETEPRDEHDKYVAHRVLKSPLLYRILYSWAFVGYIIFLGIFYIVVSFKSPSSEPGVLLSFHALYLVAGVVLLSGMARELLWRLLYQFEYYFLALNITLISVAGVIEFASYSEGPDGTLKEADARARAYFTYPAFFYTVLFMISIDSLLLLSVRFKQVIVVVLALNFLNSLIRNYASATDSKPLEFTWVFTTDTRRARMAAMTNLLIFSARYLYLTFRSPQHFMVIRSRVRYALIVSNNEEADSKRLAEIADDETNKSATV